MTDSNNSIEVEFEATSEGRYHRSELITWWDQSALLSAKVLVVGAGALGNEIVKNLALVGVGNLTIVDMDIIEHTNLARCVFFRPEHEQKFKSEILAAEANRMNSDVKTEYYTCPIQELGDGFIGQFDLIVAGLDNREARVWLGAAAKRTGRVWIDGAIEGLMGKVQTFVPDGPCYACTMGDKDWEALTKRLSCKLLGVEEMEGGHTPTNATTSSIIAGVQAQEAIKYLVGKRDYFAIENKVWRMMGEQMATFFSIVDISDDCPFHYDYIEVSSTSELPKTIGEIWENLKQDDQAVVGFYDDFIVIEGCKKCGVESKAGYKDLMKRQGMCKSCQTELNIELFSRIQHDENVASMEIIPEYWPLQTLVEFTHDGKVTRHLLERGTK